MRCLPFLYRAGEYIRNEPQESVQIRRELTSEYQEIAKAAGKDIEGRERKIESVKPTTVISVNEFNTRSFLCEVKLLPTQKPAVHAQEYSMAMMELYYSACFAVWHQ